MLSWRINLQIIIIIIIDNVCVVIHPYGVCLMQLEKYAMPIGSVTNLLLASSTKEIGVCVYFV
jgi:hypothetical protein